MDVKDLRLAVLSICSLYGASALAIEPASISDGPVAVIPQLSVQLAHDDNIFSEQTNETSSAKVIVTPSVELLAERENDAYRVRYAVENGSFLDSHDDDYTDHDLQGQSIIELNSRNRFDLQAGYLKEHEDRGTGVDDQSGGGVDKPIEYSEFNLQGLYTYGASGYFASNREVGAIVFSAQVRADATLASLEEMIAELKNYSENGMTDEELSFMRLAVGQQDALTYETPSQKASLLSSILTYSLDKDYLTGVLLYVDDMCFGTYKDNVAMYSSYISKAI